MTARACKPIPWQTPLLYAAAGPPSPRTPDMAAAAVGGGARRGSDSPTDDRWPRVSRTKRRHHGRAPSLAHLPARAAWGGEPAPTLPPSAGSATALPGASMAATRSHTGPRPSSSASLSAARREEERRRAPSEPAEVR